MIGLLPGETMSDTARLLGFAFANADVLFEIDTAGTVRFAAGAGAEFLGAGAETMIGKPSRQFFLTPGSGTFDSTVRGLGPGGRASLRLKLVSGKTANVTMFRLPDNDDRISCTISGTDGRAPTAAPAKDKATGLASRDGFLASAIKDAGDTLTLVNLPGLTEMCAGMSSEQSKSLLESLGTALAGSGAKVAGRISETSFGTVGDSAGGNTSHVARVRAVFAARGLPQARVEETLVSMKGQDLTPGQRLMALRYVVEQFAAGKCRLSSSDDLGRVFSGMLVETEQRARALADKVADGGFDIVYQPINDLTTGELSHFEALSRFGPGATQETVQFAEALGLSNAFDLAVAVKVINALETDKGHGASVAFNVSGYTIQSPSDFAMLAGLLSRKTKLAPRLLIEITETAQITDLDVAAEAIAALRKLGYRVGLDDFGAGAATLNYLHAFAVDFVKFDGSLVKKLGASKRDDMLLSAMLKLCGELGITTIAECLETEDDVKRARDAGFHHGQGYFLGAPGKIPQGAGLKGPVAKRKGVREYWG